MPRIGIQRGLWCVLLVLGIAVEVPQTGWAQAAGAGKARIAPVNPAANLPGPKNYTSRNFLVHTDLPADDANDLLQRLETMLTLISKYWGKPNAQTIEMYVVKDLKNWPANSLDPQGLASIQDGAGVTVSQARFLAGEPVATQAIVYAVADRGTPQHEAVHAYCALNFGRTGPVWYAEGMAEMGQYWREKDPSVHCHPEVIRYLKSSDPKGLTEITTTNERTGDSWQNYAWRWALCHLLANNTNYSARFRPLGLELLTGKPAGFESVYGSMAREITFEYEFFLQHLEQGYRVDLCSWDWKTKPVKLVGAANIVAKIDAAKGWQSGRLQAQAKQAYRVDCTGTWKLGKAGTAIGPAGESKGAGKLWGVILLTEKNGYKLSEPFPIGDAGEFTAQETGALFLRCHDAWNELADNSGTIAVKIQLAP